MKTTVIVPTYNRVSTLVTAVRSLLDQCATADLDIVVVDDGSTDETSTVMAAMTAEHPQLRYVWRENGGVAAARNTGLANLHPEAEFVSFLDSDDVSPAGRFATDLARFEARPALEVTYGRMVFTSALDAATMRPPADAETAEVTAIQLSCAIFRRALIARIGGFDPEFGQAEDTDYLLRVFEAGTVFEETPTLCLYYLRHPGNMTLDHAASRRFFLRAIGKSMQRRKADPAIRIDKPSFDIQLLTKTGLI